jgi:hypothetical protein
MRSLKISTKNYREMVGEIAKDTLYFERAQ